MPRKKPHARPVTHHPSPAVEKEWDRRAAASEPKTVPARWLLGVFGLVLLAAAVCAWAALCLMFWQGSWQLLYHPASAVTRTPASAGLDYNDVGFATTGTGMPRLKGWLVPAAPGAPFSSYTALYLHDATGNLGDSVDNLARLHAAGINVFAFDYRGYGQSVFVHPSEARWRQDAEWALDYLTGTRHMAPGSILLVGKGLGANLALEVAAAHPQLAGVVLQEQREDAMQIIFNDPRSRLVPAHMLVSDRWQMRAPAAALRVPSLWFYGYRNPVSASAADAPATYKQAAGPKTVAWIPASGNSSAAFHSALTRWLQALPRHGGK